MWELGQNLDLHHDNADKSESEAPAEVVVLPVGHEVPAVSHRAEDDQGDRAAGSWNGGVQKYSLFVPS